MQKKSTSLNRRQLLTEMMVTCAAASEWEKPTRHPRALIHPDYSESITKFRNNVIKMGDHKGLNAKRRVSRTATFYCTYTSVSYYWWKC